MYFCNQKFFAPQSISGNTRLGVFAFAWHRAVRPLHHDVASFPCIALPLVNPNHSLYFRMTYISCVWFNEWKNYWKKWNVYFFVLHVILLSSSGVFCLRYDNKTQRCLTSCESESVCCSILWTDCGWKDCFLLFGVHSFHSSVIGGLLWTLFSW